MVFKQVETLPFPDKAKVAGIGKAILRQDGADFHIPHLHILVIEGFTEGCFDAINLEYGLHGRGDSPKSSMYDAVEEVIKYFRSNEIHSKADFRELIKHHDDHLISDYRRIFWRTEMELALEKRDLGFSMVKSIREEAEAELLQLIDDNMKPEDQIQKLKNFLRHTERAELTLVKGAA